MFINYKFLGKCMKKIRCLIKKFIRKYMPIVESVYLVFLGNHEIRRIRKKFGENVHIIFMMGATGDTYIQLRIIDSYIKEKQLTNYVLAGYAPGISGLLPLFPDKKFYSMRDYLTNAIQKAYMLLGKEYLNITIMFPWTYTLYFNRCRIRMTERFHFMDTYRWYVLGLNNNFKLVEPKFLPLTEGLKDKFKTLGIRNGKTIILAPEANSVTTLNQEAWKLIISDLKRMGYTVLINAKEDNYGCKSIYVTYSEYEALLSYAGYFIGIRSGLCDIISSVNCKKIIIYPEKAKEVNYSEHRSEIEFCGLKIMGLVEESDTSLIEIETNLIRNITQAESEIEDQDTYLKELSKLREHILINV